MATRDFDKDGLVDAFHDLGRMAHAAGKTVEISVYGGSALTLLYDWRRSTKDVDAVFEADKLLVRRWATAIADERGWEPDWLNDGVKGFLSEGDAKPESKLLFGTFPSEEQPGLRVMVATPEYRFAMKCRAMRLGGVDENSDIEDVSRLAVALGLETVDEAFAVVAAFYPRQSLPPKTRFGLEEIFHRLGLDRQDILKDPLS